MWARQEPALKGARTGETGSYAQRFCLRIISLPEKHLAVSGLFRNLPNGVHVNGLLSVSNIVTPPTEIFK